MLARLSSAHSPTSWHILHVQQYPSEYKIAFPLASYARPQVGLLSVAASWQLIAFV